MNQGPHPANTNTNQGQARIACPRCRANNFVGKPTCWQCGGSLPPPEAAVQAAPIRALQNEAFVPPTYAAYPTPCTGTRRRMVVPVVIVLVALLGGLFVFAFHISARRPSGPVAEVQKSLDANIAKLKRDNGMGGSETDSTDPNVIRARREIDRLSDQAGFMRSPTAYGNEVPLRTGGTITREQWERAADSVKSTSQPTSGTGSGQ